MKKYFVILILLFLQLQLYSEPYKYPVVPGTIAWDTAGSSWYRIIADQIPEDVLHEMSTEDLITTIFNFPYIFEIQFFDNLNVWFGIQTGRLNAFDELSKRTDAGKILKEKYLKSEISEQLNTIFVLEGLLAQDFSLRNLSDEDKLTILNNCIEKFTKKIELKNKQKEFSYFTGCFLLAKIMYEQNDRDFKDLSIVNSNLNDFIHKGKLKNKDDLSLILLEAIKFSNKNKGDN